MMEMILMIPLESCPIAACKHHIFSNDFNLQPQFIKQYTQHSCVRTVTDLDHFVCPGGEQPASGWFILHMYDAVLTVMERCSGCPSGQEESFG